MVNYAPTFCVSGLMIIQALICLIVFCRGARLQRYGIVWVTLFVANLYFAARLVMDTGVIVITL